MNNFEGNIICIYKYINGVINIMRKVVSYSYLKDKIINSGLLFNPINFKKLFKININLNMRDQKRKHTTIKVINANKEDNTYNKNDINVELGNCNNIPVVDLNTVNINEVENNLDIASILYGHEGICVYSVVFGDVIVCEITKDKIYFCSKNCKGETFFVNNRGKSYDDGECLIFPSKTERNWAKFISDDLKPGDYIVIGNNKCILSKVSLNKTSTLCRTFNTAIAIAGEDDLYPNKIELNHIFNVTMDKVRKATIEERKEIDSVLENEGLVWDNETKSLTIKKWYPKQDETYYSLLIKGACRFFVTEDTFEGSSVDLDRYENGNCFKTREEANNWCNKFNNSSEEVSKQLINR